MADVYTLELTGDELAALLDVIKNSGVTATQLSYLDGVTSNIQNQINNHSQAASRVSAGTFGGKVVGNSTAVATLGDKQFRNITISTSEPTSSQGNNGDVWIVYSV